jgi:hypothetical membrane protein
MSATAFPLLTLAGVSVWVALVLIAQALNPDQSPVSMGMSGLATGRAGWVMRLAFVVRGLTALALVGGIHGLVPEAARSELGLALFAVWGGGSALLAAYDTDMPGDAPTSHGRAHAIIAFVAYVAAAVGMILVSLKLGEANATADTASWTLPIALFAAAAMVVQFAGFGAAARSMDEGLGRYAGLLQRVYLFTVMLWTALVAAGL